MIRSGGGGRGGVSHLAAYQIFLNREKLSGMTSVSLKVSCTSTIQIKVCWEGDKRPALV